MYARICGYVFFVASVSVMAAGCNDGPGGAAAAPTAPGLTTSVLATVEPSEIVPEFLSSPCRNLPAFRARLSVTIHSGEGRFVDGVRFEFTDHFGQRAIPNVIPAFELAAMRPNSMPVPLPTSSPIPIPGALPVGLRFPPGPRTLPFVLEFGCGVPSEGTLFVIVETTDERGRPDASRTSVDIGG